MDLDEKNVDTPSETSEIDGLASKEFEGFSQVCALSISHFFRRQLCDICYPYCCVITISFLHISVFQVLKRLIFWFYPICNLQQNLLDARGLRFIQTCLAIMCVYGCKNVFNFFLYFCSIN